METAPAPGDSTRTPLAPPSTEATETVALPFCEKLSRRIPSSPPKTGPCALITASATMVEMPP